MLERDDVVGLVGQSSEQGLVEDHAEGVDVGARVDPGAAELLGGHVGRGPDHVAGLGQVAPAQGVAGQAEVGEPGAAGLGFEDHVGRLHVAVDHPLEVRRLERLSEGRDELTGLLGQQATALREVILEGRTRDVLHGVVHAARFLPCAEQRHDPRVSNARGELGFALEARSRLGVCLALLEQELDRYRGFAGLAAEEHHPPGASAQLAQHGVGTHLLPVRAGPTRGPRAGQARVTALGLLDGVTPGKGRRRDRGARVAAALTGRPGALRPGVCALGLLEGVPRGEARFGQAGRRHTTSALGYSVGARGAARRSLRSWASDSESVYASAGAKRTSRLR